MIDITLLGTSALLPLPDRALTAAFLRCGGRGILFDCGEGTQTAARRAGVSLMKTDVIALTHYHGDHIFGLPGLLQTMCSLERTAPLILTGPKGLEEAVSPLLRLAGGLTYPVRVLPLPPEGLALDSLFPGWPAGAVLRGFATAHRVPSQGYVFTLRRSGRFLPQAAQALGVPMPLWGRLQRGETVCCGETRIEPAQVMGPPRQGLKFVFSGDTAFCPALVEAARGADLLICEATYPENEQEALARSHGHMNFAQAGRTAAEAGAARLWLAHYSQIIENPADHLPAAQVFFPDAVCGADGMHATLYFSG